MKQNVNKALDVVDATYNDLIDIANDIMEEISSDISTLIQATYNRVNDLTTDELRNIMLTLSLRCYSLAEIKEKSTFKATLAETIRKEQHARIYNSTDGAIGIRENTAIINSSEQILAEEIYTLVASMLKTKVDEVHRVVDSLKSVLMSRMQEAKFSNIEA